MTTFRDQVIFIKPLPSRVGSAVYLCRDKVSKDLVVLKQTRIERSFSARDDPWQEHAVAQLLFSLGGHPHLLNYRSARIENGSLFLLMDFCERGDLFSFLEAQPKRKLAEPLARHIFSQIAHGVRFLHQHGVAHRDISLENVLLDGKHIAKLCDFGLSAFFSSEDSGKKRSAVGRVGKSYYMAPEVVVAANGTEYDPVLADIWSLGILLFIMLTGSPLIETATPQDPVFAAVMKVGIRGVLRHWKIEAEISSATIELLDKMLQFDPARRFQSVDDLIRAMDASA